LTDFLFPRMNRQYPPRAKKLLYGTGWLRNSYLTFSFFSCNNLGKRAPVFQAIFHNRKRMLHTYSIDRACQLYFWPPCSTLVAQK